MRLVVLAFSLAVALAVAAYSFFYMRELRLTLDDGRDERGAPKSLRSRALEFINGRCVRVRARERERERRDRAGKSPSSGADARAGTCWACIALYVAAVATAPRRRAPSQRPRQRPTERATLPHVSCAIAEL
jgi:hypothetical protein